MAFSKAHHFPPEDYYFSLLCYSLSHPARILLLKKLFTTGPLSVEKLRRGIPLSNSTVSQHLRILRSLHILTCTQKSPTVIYNINPELPGTTSVLLQVLLLADKKHIIKYAMDSILIGESRKVDGV